MKKPAVVLAAVTLASVASAGPLSTSAKKREIERLSSGAARVEKDCGCKVAFTIDFASFPDETQLLGAGISGDDFADAAQRQCEDKAGRAAFCAGVKKWVISYEACPPGSKATPPSLKDGTVRTVRCIGTGISSNALWTLFDTSLDTAVEAVGDSATEADSAVKTTPEQAVAPGSAMFPPGISAEDQETLTRAWASLAEATDRVVRECRWRPNAAVDWASFKGSHRNDGTQVCEIAMTAVGYACTPRQGEKTDFSAIIRSKVKTVRCHQDPNLKPDANDRVLPRFSFKDGVFDVWVNWASDGWLYGNTSVDGANWLRANLPAK